jgi:hypothetical protein
MLVRTIIEIIVVAAAAIGVVAAANHNQLDGARVVAVDQGVLDRSVQQLPSGRRSPLPKLRARTRVGIIVRHDERNLVRVRTCCRQR